MSIDIQFWGEQVPVLQNYLKCVSKLLKFHVLVIMKSIFLGVYVLNRMISPFCAFFKIIWWKFLVFLDIYSYCKAQMICIIVFETFRAEVDYMSTLSCSSRVPDVCSRLHPVHQDQTSLEPSPDPLERTNLVLSLNYKKNKNKT